MIGEIVSAGIGLIGSLFGKKKQKTTNEVDYVKMAANAKAAGFNPLTALRNGGAAGFTTTTSPTVSQLPQALSSLGGVLGDAFEKKVDPVAQKQRQLDTALVDYQLRQLREGPKAMPGRLYPGGQTIGTKVTSVKPSMGRNAPGEGRLVGGQDPAVSSLGLNDGRYGWFHFPGMSDAETAETIYGDSEVLSMGYGAGKIAADTAYSVYRNAKSAAEDGVGRKLARRYFDFLRPAAAWTQEVIGRHRRPYKPLFSGGGGGW